MTVTLNLNPEVEKGLLARARARGVSLDDYLQEIVTREAGVPPTRRAPPSRRICLTCCSTPRLPGLTSIWSVLKTILVPLNLNERIID
jgi:hypothetical protein